MVLSTALLSSGFLGRGTLEIAAIGSTGGVYAEKGQAMVDGINLYIDEVNRRGGLNGRQLRLRVFDDRGDPELARERAREILDTTQAIAVLGHNFSSTALAARDIYEEGNIVAMTGSATADRLTDGFNWVYRVVPRTGLGADVLGNYVPQVMKWKTVAAIYDPKDDYNLSMVESFEKSLKANKGSMDYKWEFDGSAQGAALDREVRNVISKIMQLDREDRPDCLLIPLQTLPAVKLLYGMRSRGIFFPIVGSDSLGDLQLVQRLVQEYPKTFNQVGYYTDAIYVVSPVNFDIAGREAQSFRVRFTEYFGHEPDWRAAGYYDAAKTIGEALKKTTLSGGKNNLAEDRDRLRRQLNEFNSPETAISGVGGPIFFDPFGDLNRPVYISQFQDGKPISALVQLQTIPNARTLNNLPQKVADEEVIRIGNRYLYRTNVVYTGIELKEIPELDVKAGIADLEFAIWFRYQGDLDADRIEFLNAVEPIELGEPVASELVGDLNYRLYYIKGRFQLDFLPSKRFGQHIAGISFANEQLGKNRLMYVADTMSMRQNADLSLAEQLKFDRVLSPESGWKITEAILFQDTILKESQGNPIEIREQSQAGGFSRMTMGLTLGSSQVSLRGIMPIPIASYVMLGGLILVVFCYLPKRLQPLKLSKQIRWLIQTIAIITTLFAGECIVLNWLDSRVDDEYIELLIIYLNLMWWIVPTFLFVEALEYFVWEPITRVNNRPIPSLVRRIVVGVIYSLAVICMIAYVFDRPIASLLGASGLLLTIIGLAIQINISNIFAGLAINLERTFSVGDYIEIVGQNIKGTVSDINWRATYITSAGNSIAVPNSVINNCTIINYMRPTAVSATSVPITIESTIPSANVIAVLQASLDAIVNLSPKHPLSNPKPRVIIGSTFIGNVTYLLKCSYNPEAVTVDDISNVVIASALDHLTEANIQISTALPPPPTLV
jgi:branched-chain amino acid transport system substrate-binding protein